MYYEAEDFAAGEWVLTPTGRRAQVVRILSGASKFDCFSRVMVRYEGGGAKDLATLQPHLLRKAPMAKPVLIPMQMAFVF